MRLLCTISHHGLGHLAQAGPILNAMGEYRPDLEWLVWSGLPRPALEARLNMDFTHRHEPADVGLLMHDAMRVDMAASRLAYLDFHHDWSGRVSREADWLIQNQIDGVLSNVAYLPLAAAAKAGVPAVGFCSLNWWDITHHYLQGMPDMSPVFSQMREAYQSAQAFLGLTPALPMAWMPAFESMPPLAALGRNRRKEINARLKLAPNTKLVLLGFGGVVYQNPASLPALEGIAWLVPDGWATRADLIGYSQANLVFQDLMASCDALITKVGYGSFVEAAGLALPVLFLDRPDWPETPWLVAWLKRHTRAMAINEEVLFSPAMGEELNRLLQAPKTKPADISGAPATGQRILEYLEG
jgi:hypothetical protein